MDNGHFYRIPTGASRQSLLDLDEKVVCDVPLVGDPDGGGSGCEIWDTVPEIEVVFVPAHFDLPCEPDRDGPVVEVQPVYPLAADGLEGTGSHVRKVQQLGG